jgi:hypothetical protein
MAALLFVPRLLCIAIAALTNGAVALTAVTVFVVFCSAIQAASLSVELCVYGGRCAWILDVVAVMWLTLHAKRISCGIPWLVS